MNPEIEMYLYLVGMVVLTFFMVYRNKIKVKIKDQYSHNLHAYIWPNKTFLRLYELFLSPKIATPHSFMWWMMYFRPFLKKLIDLWEVDHESLNRKI